MIHQLLRERLPSVVGAGSREQASLDQASQKQLLASVYFARHISNTGSALSHASEDIEMAEALGDFLRRGDSPPDEANQNKSSIQMLVRILRLQERTVEANEPSKLPADSASTASESVRASLSTNLCRQVDFEMFDKHDVPVEVDPERPSKFSPC